LPVAGWGRIGYAPRVHLTGTLAASRVPRKNKDIFGETSIFGKTPTFSENFKPFSCT